MEYGVQSRERERVQGNVSSLWVETFRLLLLLFPLLSEASKISRPGQLVKAAATHVLRTPYSIRSTSYVLFTPATTFALMLGLLRST